MLSQPSLLASKMTRQTFPVIDQILQNVAKIASRLTILRLSLGVLLLVTVSYLGLMLFLGTSSPFMPVRGTSMEPEFHAGDLLLSRTKPTSDIQMGDVIVFEVPPDARKRLKMPSVVAHRVVGMGVEHGELAFLTKGDNSGSDPFQVPPSAVRGVVVKNLGPFAGPILSIVSKATLMYVGLPLLIFVIVVLATFRLMPDHKLEAPALAEPDAHAGSSLAEMQQALKGLASSVAEYGAHLQSHTAVVKDLAGTTEGLQRSVHKQDEASEALKNVVREQNQVLVQLGAVIRDVGSTSKRRRNPRKGSQLTTSFGRGGTDEDSGD